MNGRRVDGAGGQQHHSRSSLHQHPQADHVRTHVPENADAPHGPGWALRWRAGPACGPSGMRQTSEALIVPVNSRTSTEKHAETRK